MQNERRNAACRCAYNRQKALAAGKSRYAIFEEAERKKRIQRGHARIRGALEKYVLN